MKLQNLLFFLPIGAFGLQTEPWLTELWEFQSISSYTYSRYHHVQDAVKPLKHPSNDQDVFTGLAVTFAENWNAELEIEGADTPRVSWLVRSVAGQLRLVALDDVVGDPVTLTLGTNLRWVNGRSLKDISCPYHANGNIELNAAAGREWSFEEDWKWRAFGFLGVGSGNRGYPWARAQLAWETKFRSRHEWDLLAWGYFGFGPKHKVNIQHFHSYASIHHQSIDVALRYKYHFTLWGTLGFEYMRRVYAHSFPEGVNFFTLSYQLPFSAF